MSSSPLYSVLIILHPIPLFPSDGLPLVTEARGAREGSGQRHPYKAGVFWVI